MRKGYVSTSAKGTNHSTIEIAEAASSVIACGRAFRGIFVFIFQISAKCLPLWPQVRSESCFGFLVPLFIIGRAAFDPLLVGQGCTPLEITFGVGADGIAQFRRAAFDDLQNSLPGDRRWCGLLQR